jgi:hypothetical protein
VNSHGWKAFIKKAKHKIISIEITAFSVLISQSAIRWLSLL